MKTKSELIEEITVGGFKWQEDGTAMLQLVAEIDRPLPQTLERHARQSLLFAGLIYIAAANRWKINEQMLRGFVSCM